MTGARRTAPGPRRSKPGPDEVEVGRRAEGSDLPEQGQYRIFADSPSVMLLIDPGDGRIVDANAAAVEYYGYGRDELIAMTIGDINVLPRDEIAERMQQAIAEGLRAFVFPHRLKSGEVRTVEVFSGPLTLDGRPLLHSIIHDITEQVRTQGEMRRLASAVEQAPVAVITVRPDGTVSSWNPAAERLFGWQAAEMVGRPYPLVPEEGQSDFQEAFRHVLEGGVIRDLQAVRVTRDGRRLDVEISAAPVRDATGRVAALVAVLADRTDAVAASRSIQATRDLLGAIINASPLAMLATDVRGQVRLANAAAERLIAEVQPDDTDDPATGPLAAVLGRVRTGHTIVGEEMELGESRIPIRLYAAPLPSEEGGGVAVLQDLREERRMEAEVRAAQRMESIGRLAGGLAHDLNNMLTVISGNAELAALEVDPSSELAAGIGEIALAADRAANLIRQVLAFARPSERPTAVVDLVGVVREVEPMLRRLIREDIELATDLPDEPLRIAADEDQLVQVVMNLAVNARDAMPDGGTLRIRVASEEVDFDRLPGVRRPTGVLQVSDSGPGIDATILERIWEPFFTTKDPGQGTGLGLATVYGIVKAAGGRAMVDSRPGQGTTFTIVLPLAAQPAPPPPAVTPAAPATRAQVAGTILLAEDEPSVRRLVLQVLRSAGYEVLEAVDGLAALALAGERPIDLLVSDIVMPRMRGTELAQRLRHSHPDLPILLMTGYASDGDDEATRFPEGAVVLRKPFHPDALLEAVRGLLGRVPR